MNALKTTLERLDELINWERRDRSAGFRQNLLPIEDLLRRLGNPHLVAPAVHVAGTKGKGSVTALVAAGLARAGHKTGAYTSPHVERMNERIALDGKPVNDELLSAALECVLAFREEALSEDGHARDATWFDLVTAAAFWIFEHEKRDWNVVEVGLGGRLDSTNAVQPEVCVVTGIELEHTTILGSTRAAIAAEKGGILKEGAIFVCGLVPEDPAGRVLLDRARELDLFVRIVSGKQGERVLSPSEHNLALAQAALDALGIRGHTDRDGEPLHGGLLDDEVVRAARLPGRLERRRLGRVPVVLDGAHVPASFTSVLNELERAEPGAGPPVGVLALARDKDAEGCLKALAGRVDRLLCTSVAGGLFRGADELVELARAAGIQAEAVAEPGEAVQRAARAAPPGGWVLVVGSLYLVGAVRGLLSPENPAC